MVEYEKFIPPYNPLKPCVITTHFNGSKLTSITHLAVYYPRPPLAPMGIFVGHCIRPSVRLSVCPSVSLSVRPERRYRFNSLRISAFSLTFGGMMHTAVEQIAIKNGHARPIVAGSSEHYRPRPGRWNWGIHITACIFFDMRCSSPWNGSVYEIAAHG